jgi:manganese oxidase
LIPSAGGIDMLAGDYVWNNQRLPYSQSGQWGYFRVLPKNDQRIMPLEGGAKDVKQAFNDPVDGGRALPVAVK